ncbi:hypothetical protein SDC9_156315 [bioreactor metagenome]|uniref:Uncharacterized protein n=1 Tax=bioreactor metagenome TaxID=1076179 RepID=A0A645F4C8_9ZZZZ
MRHDDHRILCLQLQHQVFNLGGGDGVQRAGRLIHQQHFRLHRQAAGDAQALLLPAGDGHGALFQVVLHLIPEGGLRKRAFNDLIQLRLALGAVHSRAIGNVVVDGHGKRVGLLKHHAHPLAQHVHFHPGGVDIFPVQQKSARDAAAGDEIVHPVKGFEQRGFAAAGRPDKGRHLSGGYPHGDVFERLKVGIPQIGIPYVKGDACGAFGRISGCACVEFKIGHLSALPGATAPRRFGANAEF